MKVELNDNVQTMSVTEVVNALVSSGALEIDNGERLGEARLECGCDLEIDIMHDDSMDMRIHGCLSHTETFTEEDIRADFVNADYCAWAKDEDGNDVLLCFGAC